MIHEIYDLDKFNLNYQGFMPSDSTKTHLCSLMRGIHDLAPSSSAMWATFSHKDKMYRARVKINSFAGTFFAVATGKQLSDVTKKISTQIKHKLDKWKSLRFKGEHIIDFMNETPLLTEGGYNE